MFEHENDSKGIAVSLLQAGTLMLALLFLAPMQIQVSFGQEGVAVAVQSDSPAESPASSEASDTEDKVDEVAAALQGADSEVSDDESMDLDTIVADAFDDSNEDDGTQPAEVETGEVVELSVEPGTEPVMPAEYPAWIEAKPDYSTDIHRLVVGSDIVDDPDEVDGALDAPLVAAVKNYIDDKVFNSYGESDLLDVDARFIRRNLINDVEGEVLELNASGEPMFRKWVMVEITPQQREYFSQKRRESMQMGRLAPLTAGLVAVLGVVGLSHLLLRRKHGLATAQPLAGDGLVANPVSVAKQRSGSGILGFLFLGFGLLVCGVLLVGFLALFASHKSIEVRSNEIPTAVKTRLGDLPQMPDMPDMPAMPDMPEMTVEKTLEKSVNGGYTHETTITSGGQTIHIKRK
ncbi:MAG: hypothetical protein AAGG44_04330 [Planctomycetota bacterium]